MATVLNKHLSVLIVGAGPTGLMMACELARHGIAFRIIDKKPERTLSSNATWIQTRTLEIFDLIGISDRFIKMSNACNAINLYIEGKSLMKIPLNHIDSTFPYILILPQSETEKLLSQHLEKLNIKIERHSELTAIQQNNNDVTSTIRHQDGRIETIISDWLIACDGANSTVREKCKLDFAGEDLKEQFIVADAEIDSFMSKDEVHIFFDNGSLFAAFPLGANKYRITANLHLTHLRKIFTEREVIEMAQERAHGAYYVKSVSWISPFWIHGKIVKHLRHGSIFLAGDAAHIHSPAGGQGMNTGIQDAYNLAWKLALVIKGQAKPLLLDSYHDERYPVVKKTVDQSDHYTKMALLEHSFLIKLRQFERKITHDQGQLAKKIGEQLTQLSIQYQPSPVIADESTSKKIIQAGVRAPDVIIDTSTRLYDYLRNTKHNILLFAGLTMSKSQLAKIIALQKSLAQFDADLIKTQVIAKEKITDVKNIILDPEAVIHNHYQIKNSTICIIRPDNYIAYCSKKLDFEPIESFFKKYLSKE